MIKLSPLQEIFILLEEEKFVPLYRLNRWGLQARGVLAKLKHQGFIQRTIINNDKGYKITEKGEIEFDNILKVLKDRDKWDKKWRMVIFNIPEKNRDLRDRLRRELSRIGLGMMQPSVWISPLNIKEELDATIIKLGLKDNLKYFELSSINGINRNIIDKTWNISELLDDYKEFIRSGQKTLKTISKDTNPKYSAKRLIFQYALILKKDPIIYTESTNDNEIRNQANDIYKILRSHALDTKN